MWKSLKEFVKSNEYLKKEFYSTDSLVMIQFILFAISLQLIIHFVDDSSAIEQSLIYFCALFVLIMGASMVLHRLFISLIKDKKDRNKKKQVKLPVS